MTLSADVGHGSDDRGCEMAHEGLGDDEDRPGSVRPVLEPHPFKPRNQAPPTLSALGGPMPGWGGMPSFIANGPVGTRGELACRVCGRRRDDEIHD